MFFRMLSASRDPDRPLSPLSQDAARRGEVRVRWRCWWDDETRPSTRKMKTNAALRQMTGENESGPTPEPHRTCTQHRARIFSDLALPASLSSLRATVKFTNCKAHNTIRRWRSRNQFLRRRTTTSLAGPAGVARGTRHRRTPTA